MTNRITLRNFFRTIVFAYVSSNQNHVSLKNHIYNTKSTICSRQWIVPKHCSKWNKQKMLYFGTVAW